MKNGSYTAAITSYNELINKHPESQLAIKASQDISVVFYDQAHDYHDNGLLDESIATYKSIIANYPDSQSAIKASQELPLVFYDQAHDFHENGSLDESIATYKDIITNFPDSQSAIKASQDLPLVIAEQYCQSSDSGSSVNDFKSLNTNARGVYSCTNLIDLTDKFTPRDGGTIISSELRYTLKLEESSVKDNLCGDSEYTISPNPIKMDCNHQRSIHTSRCGTKRFSRKQIRVSRIFRVY